MWGKEQIADKERMANAAPATRNGRASDRAGFASEMKKLILGGDLSRGIVVERIDTAGEGKHESVTIEFRVPKKIGETVDDAGVIRASSDGPVYTFTFSARHSTSANVRRFKAYFSRRSKAVAEFAVNAAGRRTHASMHPAKLLASRKALPPRTIDAEHS